MNPALWFLARRSLVNAVRTRLLRLKQPRYLVMFLVGVAYFVFVFGMQSWDDRPHRVRPGDAPSEEELLAATILADRRAAIFWEWGTTAALLLFGFGSWLLPSKGPPLQFLESEVAQLFPAPLSRREIVQYKVLDLHRTLLLPFLFIAALFGWKNGASSFVWFAVALPLFFSLSTLHGIGAKLTRMNLLQNGVSGLRRTAIALAVLAGLVALVVLTVPRFPSFPDAKSVPGVLANWLEAVGASPAGWALYPLRLPGRMLGAGDPGTMLWRAIPVAGIAVLLYLWVVRCDAAFEEAADAQAAVFARRIDQAKRGKLTFSSEEKTRARRTPFRLAPVGPPETAFVWKSGTEMLRHVPLRLVILLFAVVPAGLGIAFGVAKDVTLAGRGDAPPLLPVLTAVLSLFMAGMLAMVGPAMVGTNLRGEMEMIETLKTLPVTGPRLVRSSLAGTVVPLALMQAFLVLVAATVFPVVEARGVTLAWKLAAAGALILVLPCITAISALVDAAAAIWFPAWLRPGQNQAGTERMGSGIVFMLGKVIFMGLGAGLPLGVGAGAAVLVGALGGPVVLPAAVLLGAALAAVLMGAILWVASSPLGQRFEDMDPAAEGILN